MFRNMFHTTVYNIVHNNVHYMFHNNVHYMFHAMSYFFFLFFLVLMLWAIRKMVSPHKWPNLGTHSKLQA